MKRFSKLKSFKHSESKLQSIGYLVKLVLKNIFAEIRIRINIIAKILIGRNFIISIDGYGSVQSSTIVKSTGYHKVLRLVLVAEKHAKNNADEAVESFKKNGLSYSQAISAVEDVENSRELIMLLTSKYSEKEITNA